MANARIIRQNFFNNPQISTFDPMERYLLIGLACAADDFGRLWGNCDNLKSTMFPVDKNITSDWISQSIESFIKHEILCEYEVYGNTYYHFPKWFDKGWFLKQRIDHPREFGSPDCPICQTEVKKRESSRAIKNNVVKQKEIKENVIKRISSPTYYDQITNRYPLIDSKTYKYLLDGYVTKCQNTSEEISEREFRNILFIENTKKEKESING
tara:strand:+ start:677 stop:1312 length:636 start_codon:yes stop_codon:yes gene_type:complete